MKSTAELIYESGKKQIVCPHCNAFFKQPHMFASDAKKIKHFDVTCNDCKKVFRLYYDETVNMLFPDLIPKTTTRAIPKNGQDRRKKTDRGKAK